MVLGGDFGRDCIHSDYMGLGGVLGNYNELIEEANMAKKLLDNANLQCIKTLTRQIQEESDNGVISYSTRNYFTQVVLNHFREQGIQIIEKKKFNIIDGCYKITIFRWGVFEK